jgi:hypothetical protein
VYAGALFLPAALQPAERRLNPADTFTTFRFSSASASRPEAITTKPGHASQKGRCNVYIGGGVVTLIVIILLLIILL